VWPWAPLCRCLAGPTLRRLSGTVLGCWPRLRQRPEPERFPRAGAIRSAHRRDRHNRSRVRLRAIQSSPLHRSGQSRADIRRRTMDRAIRQQPLAAQWCISGIRPRGLSRARRAGRFIEAVRNCASKNRSRYASASRPACSWSAASGPSGQGTSRASPGPRSLRGGLPISHVGVHRCRPACHAAHGTPRRRQGGQARKPILLAAFAILRFAMCALHALRRPLLAGRCVTPRRRRQRHPRGHLNSLWIDGTSWSDWTSSKRPCVGRIPRYRRRDDRDRERVLTDRTSRVACDERTVVLISASSAGVVRRIALSDH
jgi:hypothetical protein